MMEEHGKVIFPKSINVLYLGVFLFISIHFLSCEEDFRECYYEIDSDTQLVVEKKVIDIGFKDYSVSRNIIIIHRGDSVALSIPESRYFNFFVRKRKIQIDSFEIESLWFYNFDNPMFKVVDLKNRVKLDSKSIITSTNDMCACSDATCTEGCVLIEDCN